MPLCITENDREGILADHKLSWKVNINFFLSKRCAVEGEDKTIGRDGSMVIQKLK